MIHFNIINVPENKLNLMIIKALKDLMNMADIEEIFKSNNFTKSTKMYFLCWPLLYVTKIWKKTIAKRN